MEMDTKFDNRETILIEAMKEGERASFDRIVEMYQQRGISIAYNIVGNLEDAKDILQEAFVKVYTNIKSFHGQSRFSTWFYRIVVNCALDLLRKRRKTSQMFRGSLVDEEGREKVEQVPDSSFEPARVALTNELKYALDNGIADLSKKQRVCFVLKYQNGLTIEEISQVIKCSPSTVKVHLFRAIRNLEKKLTRYIKE